MTRHERGVDGLRRAAGRQRRARRRGCARSVVRDRGGPRRPRAARVVRRRRRAPTSDTASRYDGTASAAARGGDRETHRAVRGLDVEDSGRRTRGNRSLKPSRSRAVRRSARRLQHASGQHDRRRTSIASRAATDVAASASSMAPTARIRCATGSLLAGGGFDVPASAAIAAGLRPSLVDLADEILRPRDVVVREDARRQRGGFSRVRRPRAPPRAAPGGRSSTRCPRRRGRSPSRRSAPRGPGRRGRRRSSRCPATTTTPAASPTPASSAISASLTTSARARWPMRPRIACTVSASRGRSTPGHAEADDGRPRPGHAADGRLDDLVQDLLDLELARPPAGWRPRPRASVEDLARRRSAS